MSTILVDMDGVLVDWTAEFEMDLKSYFPEMVFEELREFTTPTHLPQEQQDAINWVKNRSGFYERMTPIIGGIEAVNLLANEHQVFLCSSPEVFNDTCESDKKMWVRRHMGDSWANRLILTRDKTVVVADWLIDDRPTVLGIMRPIWRQIVFTQPYNEDVKSRWRINSWRTWREDLGDTHL